MNWNQFDVNLWFNQWGNEKGSYRIFVFSVEFFYAFFFVTENENKLGRKSVRWINWCENQKTIYILTKQRYICCMLVDKRDFFRSSVFVEVGMFDVNIKDERWRKK